MASNEFHMYSRDLAKSAQNPWSATRRETDLPEAVCSQKYGIEDCKTA